MFMSFFDVKKGKCRGSKKESYLHAHNTNTDDVLICSQHLQQWLNYSETDRLKNSWNDWRSATSNFWWRIKRANLA